MSDATAKKYRVAYLVTHPIQYQTPLLRRVAADPDIHLKAFFGTDFSTRHFFDPEFNQMLQWDVPLLEGYEYEFLPIMPGMHFPEDRHFDRWRPFSIGLRKRLIAGRFDALWIHGYARAPHLWAMLAASGTGVKILLRDEASGIGRASNGLKAAVKRALFGLIDRHVDAYLTIGTANEEHYRALGIDPRKFHRMVYAVDNAWFEDRFAEARPQREALRAELNVPPGRPIVLSAAKLTERKAPFDLLQAFARAIDGMPQERRPVLLMAGDGDMRAQVEAAVVSLGLDEPVRLLGFQPQQKMPALYDLCDVSVLTSAQETWGLVVNEAMIAGKAVIASDRVGAARDLVKNGVNGFVYPFGDIAALAGHLREAVADPGRLASMGNESRRLIADWSFAQNIVGLKAALLATVGPR
ncbi:MAG: glycosyltransferase family 4 protein [Alphaproteobacteria bacterium]|nr:glycosyltransferase family 4 protein [Alphaproteobacteria bacterium]